MKRFVSILLLLALLLGCLPISALAAGEEGYFYFSASTQSSLIIAPERVCYTSGQTIKQALAASGHVFTGLESGIVTAIDGTAGNFVRGDETGDYNLDKQASSVNYFAFREASDSALSLAFQSLMQAMADYLYEEADVQQAAKAAYDNAYNSYPGADDALAQSLADALEKAVSDYKTGLNTGYSVLFPQFTGSEYTIYAVNAYGRRIDMEDGELLLPDGAYTFYIYKANKAVSGTLTVSGGAQTVNDLPSIPTAEWINENAFAISQSSDYLSAADFENAQLNLTHGTHTASAELPDTFQSQLYPYVTLNSDAALSAIYTSSADEAVKTVELASGSKRTALYNVLAKGAAGNTVTFRASKEDSGYTLLEDFTLTLDRTLTLSGLRVTNESGTPQIATESFSPDKTAYTYKVLDSEKTLKIYPVATASGVSVKVNGAELNADGCASVDISKETQISVVLTAGDYTSTYTLTVIPGAGSKVRLKLDEGVESVVVKNSSSEILTPDTNSTEKVKYYTLVVGQQYSYFATGSTYYHIEGTFTLTEAGVTNGYTVSIPMDKMPSLSDLQVSTAKELSAAKLELNTEFASGTHEYTTTVADHDSSLYAWAAPAEGTSAECTVSYSVISKQATDGTLKKVTPTANLLKDGTQLENVLLMQNAYGNTLTFRVAKTTKDATGTTTYSTDYVLHVTRGLTLQKLEITGVTLNFLRAHKTYTITVPAAQTTLSLTPTAWDNARYNGTDGGYDLYVSGKAAESGKASAIELSGTSETETVTVKVESRDEKSQPVTYTITVQKAVGSQVTFNVEPTGALLYIFDKDSGNRVWPDDGGACDISTGFTYGYSVTKPGFAGKSGYFKLENGSLVFGVMKSGEVDYSGGETHNIDTPYQISLEAAPKNTQINENLPSAWPNFRGSASNNGVTTAKTPIEAEAGTLYWAVPIGSDYGLGAVSSPILVDGDLVVNKGNAILKIDKDTGEIKKTGTMVGSSSFAINGPTYADGVILVGLANGLVQAFNAETLESLWIYADLLGGQPNSPITVHNGYAYTGFWNSETGNAAFVCLSLTDEDPDASRESKPATWRHVQKGGFYWAGAYACDDFVMVGTDDGDGSCTSPTANLLLFEPETGRLLDSKTNIIGDIRSSICYDDATNAYYFTTKGGYFYKVTVSRQTDGTYKLGEPEKIALGGMSTSTPVVYNGRVYVGVSGAAQFGDGGHNLSVIDLKSKKVAYTVPTNGYPQTSGLLTTAYGDCNYIYFFENMQPGTLRLLRDQPEQTAVDTTYQTKETAGMTAYALFTPAGKQAQYAICSPIADENGTLYFKNDTGYLMAFGSAIVPDSLTVVSQPTKLVYQAGDTFDKTGLKVTAQFTDGTTRDVTKLMAQEVPAALTEGTPDVTLMCAPVHIMYHNKQNTDKTMTSRVETNKPTVQISITVGGVSGSMDSVNWGYAANRLTLSGTFPAGAKLIAATYDETGKMTAAKAFNALGSAEITGAKIKLFLLDSTGKPVCASVTVTGS